LEAAIIYMWTGGMIASPGCIATGPTAPPHDGSTIAPPEGFLWIDTSTTPTFLPPPVTTGTTIQTYTDPNTGDIFIAKNGVHSGAWKRPRDVLHANGSRAAAFTFGSPTTPIPLDTINLDPMGMWNGSAFVAPITGLYLLSGGISVSCAPTGNVYLNVLLNGTPNTATVMTNSGSGSYTNPLHITVILHMNTGDLYQIAGAAAPAAGAGQLFGGAPYNYANIDYLGTS
jgi:hypothetical protein